MWKTFLFHLKLLIQSPKDYLYSYCYDNKTIRIMPFDMAVYRKGRILSGKIRRLCPRLRVNLIGSVGLKIEGEGDIDIYAGAKKAYLPEYYRKIGRVFGTPARIRPDYREWEFEYRGVPVELHVTDEDNSRYRKQIKLFRLLKNTPRYLEEYRGLKKSASGGSKRAYVRAKMELFNRITAKI